MGNDNLKTYGEQAATLSAYYNALPTPDLLPAFAEYILSLPDKTGKRALDIGCGSGRDAFWMASQGIPVVAIDGAESMLAEARASHSHPLIHYIEDKAPELAALTKMGRKYDIVLMSAFLFHFEAHDRFAFYNSLTPLLRPDSYIYLTLRHGPIPEGRKMYRVPLQELEDFAKAHKGLSYYHGLEDDPFKRPGVSWDHVSLKLP